MAFSSTIFKSPLIKSKLKKTVVSSSIFRGKRLTDGSLLKSESKPERTLIETNNILLDIQKQLAIDFAYRIQKEEKDIKKIKKVNENVKRSNLSKGILSGIVESFTKPITNILGGVFNRILSFFGLLATGFVVNKGIKWLSDNPEKIDETFNFITKHWKLISGIVVTGIIGATLASMASHVLLLRAIFRSIPGIRKTPKIPKTPKTPKIPNSKIIIPKIPVLPPSSLSRLNASHARNIAGKANIGDKARLLKRGFIGSSFFKK